MELPTISTQIELFLDELQQNAHTQVDVARITQPYKAYESKLRQIYAQEPNNPLTNLNHLVSVFAAQQHLTIRARALDKETEAEKERFLLALSHGDRRAHGSSATVNSLKEFRSNFNLFSESSLVDLDWSNVIVAGSAVLTALLTVDAPHNKSKRALRSYYHEKLAPASDVDIFIYGLDQEQAIEKIKKIEANVRDSILAETTTIRTKNAITIVSEYPTRHVQIVLRLYKNISEILTGFDVDCSCVAYDGQKVWAAPRALAALATQTNTIDLTRRSPSYENRLSKYAHRGFEIHWPGIDRTRIDPTIYERSFARVVGLARLLVLEKLPYPSDRDQFLARRRIERGRPELPYTARNRHALPGNVKDADPDDVPEWYDEDQVSSYHTFTVPYGPKYNAKRVEKLLFKKDLLLNAEWNKSEDRKTTLHRHPAFFGNVNDVIMDCCGFCPVPVTDDDLAAHEEEHKLFISGKLTFMEDDPGRQAIGSFNPITEDDWTDMAYVGSTSLLCQSIVDNDLEGIKDWLLDGGDVNRRDHTGRTPLHLAAMSASSEVVQYLIDHGARLIPRLYNGMTALHMAAHRGSTDIVKALLEKSLANETEYDRKKAARKQARRNTAAQTSIMREDAPAKDATFVAADEDSDHLEEIGIDGDDDDNDSSIDDKMTDGSFIKIRSSQSQHDVEEIDEPDYYDVGILAWDAPVSPLHLAIMAGHTEVIELLVDSYGADVLLPVKITNVPIAAIMSLVLPLELSVQQSNNVIRTLIAKGASPAQVDMYGVTALHYIVAKAKSKVLDLLQQISADSVNETVMNHLAVGKYSSYYSEGVENPLLAAIRTGSVETVNKVLAMGAKPQIEFEVFAKAWLGPNNFSNDPEQIETKFVTEVDQPVIEAAKTHDMADVVDALVDLGADVNSVTKEARSMMIGRSRGHSGTPSSLLDMVRERIKALQKFTETDVQSTEHVKHVKPVKPNEASLTGLQTYQLWLTKGNQATANIIHELQIQKYKQDVKTSKSEDVPGLEGKQMAVQNMRAKFQELALKLVAKGAKPFVEIYPEAREEQTSSPGPRQTRHYGDNHKPWVNKLSYMVPDLTETKKAAYTELFEACFNGDAEAVKLLCVEGKDGGAPLQIAVQDLAGFSPFSIAIIRGHQELATMILDVAAAQYAPSEHDAAKYKYSLRLSNDNDAYGSDNEDDLSDTPDFVRESANVKFTDDDLLTRAKDVKSRVSPAAMFSWTCELWRTADDTMGSEEAKAFYRPLVRLDSYQYSYADDKSSPWPWFHHMINSDRNRCRSSLIRYAIAENNMPLLEYLLRMSKNLQYRQEDQTSLEKMQPVYGDVEFALSLGRSEMLSQMIRHTGILLPLEKLAKSSGVKIEEHPKYYQGLSVHGQKRADWAAFGPGDHDQSGLLRGSSPFLLAILSGNLTSVEYFLSDTPLRQYEEFADAFAHDTRVRSLTSAKDGIGNALSVWMNTRCHLALHMAVMAPRLRSVKLLEYLLKRLPQYLDAKSETGETPLQSAYKLKNYDAARLLISAGADQTTRNKGGENLMHTIYNQCGSGSDNDLLKSCVSMLDIGIVKRLLVQRRKYGGTSSQTPFAMMCDQHHSAIPFSTLDIMLNYSDARELRIIDGAGDYILHQLVRQNKNEMALHLAKLFPDLLFVENATGMTPLQVADTAWLKDYIKNPPKVQLSQWNRQSRTDILDKAPINFVQNSSGDPEPQTPLRVELHSIADKEPRPRKLVSLLDANEIARRLAEQQQKANEAFKRLRETRYETARQSPAQRREQQQDEVQYFWTQAEQNQKL